MTPHPIKEGEEEMEAIIEQPDGTIIVKEMGEPYCGEDFCDRCGDCLYCYGDHCDRGCRWFLDYSSYLERLQEIKNDH